MWRKSKRRRSCYSYKPWLLVFTWIYSRLRCCNLESNCLIGRRGELKGNTLASKVLLKQIGIYNSFFFPRSLSFPAVVSRRLLWRPMILGAAIVWTRLAYC
ncbi:hypothetical protein F5Y03DRAFT_349525 [Xylaria venustula]|nr:hypothetical protein F5Y03DRAFT_349525 [Xylaria venustula]